MDLANWACELHQNSPQELSIYNYIYDHRFGLGVASLHLAGPCSIPGQVNFLLEVFSEIFLNYKTNGRKYRPHSSTGII